MSDDQDFFLFVGSADSESATTQLRAGGAIYRKKMLRSKPENWLEIARLVRSPRNRGTLIVLNRHDYGTILSSGWQEAAKELLDGLVGRRHVVFVHEAVFLTDEQRAAADGENVERDIPVDVTPWLDDEDYFGMSQEEFFGSIDPDLRDRVNTMLRDRNLDVVPYRSNVERSVIASRFLENSEKHLLFRIYVPAGRLYAQEAESLLGMFREWLGQTGRNSVRQEGYSTHAGQVFEFFSGKEEPHGGLTQTFEDFTAFLENCVAVPEAATRELVSFGANQGTAALLVSRFGTKARRLSLDLRQRREERVLTIKHQFENVLLEGEGLDEAAFGQLLDELVPLPTAGSALAVGGSPGVASPALTVNNFNPQFVSQVNGAVVQSVAGNLNLGAQARELLDLVATYGGDSRDLLESAVHELEDEEAPGVDRLAARARLKRFLADVGNRGLNIGTAVLQKYVEHKVGIS